MTSTSLFHGFLNHELNTKTRNIDVPVVKYCQTFHNAFLLWSFAPLLAHFMGQQFDDDIVIRTTQNEMKVLKTEKGKKEITYRINTCH